MAVNGIFPQNPSIPIGYNSGTVANQPSYGYINSPMYGQPQRTYVPQQPLNQTIPQQSTLPAIRGRMVNDESEIIAQEVPMDGTVSFFPKSDYSCIYAKIWNADYGISTFKFILEEETVVDKKTEKVDSNELEEVHKKLDEILDSLRKPKKPYQQNKVRNNHNNKEQTDES